LEAAKDALNLDCRNRKDKFVTQSGKFVNVLVGDKDANASQMSAALGLSSQVYQTAAEYMQVCIDTTDLLRDARTEHEVFLLKKAMLLRLAAVVNSYAKLLEPSPHQ